MGFQPGVENIEAETVEHLGDETSGRLLSVHADSEGLHTAQEKEGVERRKSVTNGVDHETNVFCEVFSIAHDDPGHEVMVTRQVFGGAVINDIRAVFQRALEVWAHHRIVNHDNCVWGSLLDLRANFGKIDDFEQRVGWGLE